LALAAAVAGLAVLGGVLAMGIAFLPAFGYTGWVVAALAALWLWLVWGLRRRRRSQLIIPTGRQRWLRGLLGAARFLCIGVLTGWLGLFGFAAFGPGGPAPEPKADAVLIRVMSWNIHCGQDHGLPWKQFNWPLRKHALRAALDQTRPDILGVQEATPEQVAFLEEALDSCRRVGIGRDGEAGGEHCAIFFNRQRFEMIDSGTFWLEEPIDQPRAGGPLGVKRICTWVRLRDLVNQRTVRIYNTHLYLTEAPRWTAAAIIVDHIAAGDAADAVVLTADFNATPSKPSRQLFRRAGLVDSAERAGLPAGQATFHFFYGIAVQCIDGILVDSHWNVRNHRVVDVKPQNVFPSDHFGLLADLELRKSASGPR
jgi:endonuclease/exonuclease/phosphatase family metal-dependent hydrolase